MILRRMKSNLLEIKPGANLSTKTIYVRMPRRIGKYNEESKISAWCSLHPKLNDALNDSIAKVNQYILTITSCNSYEHYDRTGKLSKKGKNLFWMEIDNLLEKFHNDKIKLLPNPKNPPTQKRSIHSEGISIGSMLHIEHIRR